MSVVREPRAPSELLQEARRAAKHAASVLHELRRDHGGHFDAISLGQTIIEQEDALEGIKRLIRWVSR